jgi:dTDP-4-amino-4,6-dideoxygalactose transaminase
MIMEKLAMDGGQPVRESPFPSWPYFDEHEKAGLLDALMGNVWGGVRGAPLGQELQARFAAYHQASYGIAVANGTVSLEIALAALGIGAGDEVIVPPYTFISTATAVLKVNALPIFVDIDPLTYCIDPAAVEAALTPRTRAIIPVHFAGHPADMDRLLAIKERHHLAIIEDAAHAHGAVWSDRKVGALGDFGSFSFQSSKNMTCGEGGMLLTNNPALAERAESLHTCGRPPNGAWYEHTLLGGNYRLTEFQSAILLAQLDRLPGQVVRREENARFLDEELADIPGLRPQGRDPRCTVHAHHLYMFRYGSHAFGGTSLGDFTAALRAEGIPASSGYPIPLHRQPLFEKRAFDLKATGYNPDYLPTCFEKLDLPESERACRETVWLPQNVLLGTRADMQDIVAALRKIQQVRGAAFRTP